MNFNFNIIELCVILSSILIRARPDISSMNGASTFNNLCSLGFRHCACSLGIIGRDLFIILKLQSHEFMTPSNSKTFLDT